MRGVSLCAFFRLSRARLAKIRGLQRVSYAVARRRGVKATVPPGGPTAGVRSTVRGRHRDENHPGVSHSRARGERPTERASDETEKSVRSCVCESVRVRASLYGVADGGQEGAARCVRATVWPTYVRRHTLRHRFSRMSESTEGTRRRWRRGVGSSVGSTKSN